LRLVLGNTAALRLTKHFSYSRLTQLLNTVLRGYLQLDLTQICSSILYITLAPGEIFAAYSLLSVANTKFSCRDATVNTLHAPFATPEDLRL